MTQESFKRHTLFVTRPSFSSFPQPNRERLSHEVNKRRRFSSGSPPPSTRSQQKTQAMRHDIYRLRVSFSGGARPAGGGRSRGRRAEHTAWRSARAGALADPAGGGGRRGPVDGGGQAGGDRTAKPARDHKNTVGRRECTGPQPFGQNTSLNPNSAQLSSSSRPNHT